MILPINNALKVQYSSKKNKTQNKNISNLPTFKAVQMLEVSSKYRHLERDLISEIKQFQIQLRSRDTKNGDRLYLSTNLHKIIKYRQISPCFECRM